MGSTEITIENLNNGTKYYFYTRCFKKDGNTRTALGEPAETAPRPEWSDITVYEFKSVPGNPSAMYLKEGKAISFVWDNKDSIDLYLGTVNEDDSDGDLMLKSPSLVQSGQNWSERLSKIKLLGTESFDSYISTTDGNWASSSEVAASFGSVYAIKTPDNHFVKLQIIGMSGTYPNRNISVKWAYQMVLNYPRF